MTGLKLLVFGVGMAFTLFWFLNGYYGYTILNFAGSVAYLVWGMNSRD